MKKIIVLGALVVKEERILLARRKPEKAMAGKWEFPGGKLKDDETEQECIKREIKEEMNVDIEVLKYFDTSVYIYPYKTIELRCYYAKLLNEDLKLSDHSEIVWVDRGSLFKYDLAPADILIAQKIGEGKV